MKGYAALLNPESPPAILELIADYIHHRGSLSFVFCDSVEHQGPYVELALVRKDHGPWKVLLPFSYILAICNASETQDGLGFLRDKEYSSDKTPNPTFNPVRLAHWTALTRRRLTLR